MSNHFEGLGKTWLTLLNDPEKEVPAVVMQVMKEGKTRDCWQRKDSKEETMVLAWPVETGFRAGVTIYGKAGEQLRPVSTYPLLEGAPNDMTVNETYSWANETEGEVSAICNEGGNPLWFYSPFLFRDRENLTPGVRHTFLIAGLAYGLRRALLDEMTITEGVEYERYVAEWLAQNRRPAAHRGSQRRPHRRPRRCGQRIPDPRPRHVRGGNGLRDRKGLHADRGIRPQHAEPAPLPPLRPRARLQDRPASRG